MDKQFLGRGWRFPILPDATGRLGYTEAGENIEHSLKVLLLTALGERMMRYDFGCEVPRLVFAPGSQRYLGLLETSIRDAIRDWEPRIELESVHAEADVKDAERVQVSIAYKIRQTNTRMNLVFPFYLGTLELA